MIRLGYLLQIALIFCSISTAYAQKLTFSYDAAGNQTERKWVCVNCPAASGLTDLTTKLSSTRDEESNLVRSIRVSPNPLTEDLNVIWQTPKDVFVKRIEVFDIRGTRVFTSIYKPDQRETQISFGRLSPGVYLLIGYYSDSKSDSIKLIKI